MRKKALVLALLLMGMLPLAFNIQPVRAWWDLEVKVMPERLGLNDLVNVTVSFTFPNIPPYVEEFGPLNRVGNTFFVNVTVYLPGPWDIIYFLQHTEEYVYHLGNLCAGQYKFEVYVERINNMVGYQLERTVEFAVFTTATVDINPSTLNLKSKGRWITAYIELPEGYDVGDIDVSTIVLNDTIPAEMHPTGIGDKDGDGIPDLMVEFDRAIVQSFIYSQGISYGDVALTITGELFDGTPFEGTYTIRVIFAGDVNNDEVIDIFDIGVVSAHWHSGPPTGPLGYDSSSDLNNDEAIDIFDIGILSVNWGQTVP